MSLVYPWSKIEKAAQKEKQITVKEAIEQEKKKRKRDKKE